MDVDAVAPQLFAWHREFSASSSVEEHMRILVAAVWAASVLVFPGANAAPGLTPGKPAGVKQAMGTTERKEMYVFAVTFLASAALAIALLKGKSATVIPASTSP